MRVVVSGVGPNMAFRPPTMEREPVLGCSKSHTSEGDYFPSPPKERCSLAGGPTWA